MAKLIKGYYKDGVWHEYGGKLYDTIGYNTNGSMTQKAITDILGSVMEVVSGYSMVVRVHGDASVTNLNPFYFVTDGESFTITITYNQPAIALNVISIIMDGTDITQEAYQDGIISIDRVTGNVVITVETASVTDTTMFTKRTTGNGITVLNNKALLKGIRGNTYDFGDGVILNNCMTNYISKDGEENVLQNVAIDVTTLTGKLNGEGESVVVFPNGMASPYIKQVEYVQKTSNDWSAFVVDYIPTGDDIKIKFKFNYQGWVSTGSYRQCFGTTRAGTTINAYRLVEATNTGNRFYGQCGAQTYVGITDVVSTNIDHEVELSFGVTKIDGKTYTASTSKGSANVETIKLFMGIEAKLYYFQVYKADVLVVDLIPVVDGNGEPNFYDKIAKKLCTHANGWDDESVWVVGADVEEQPVYDEIKKVNGVWMAIKRNNTSGLMEQEEVYVLDDQTIPTEITVADQGVEEILPINEATPTTAPAIMEIQYGSIPSRGLLGGLLGGTKGGGSNEPDYSDGEEITDYEEEQETNEDSDEPIVEEPLEEPSDEEPKEDENEEEPKEDIKESPVIDEKQELKK